MTRRLGATRFAFTQKAHAILRLRDEADALVLARQILAALGEVVEVPVDLVRAYAREKYQGGDAEWCAFIDGGDARHQKDWRKWISRT